MKRSSKIKKLALGEEVISLQYFSGLKIVKTKDAKGNVIDKKITPLLNIQTQESGIELYE